MPGRTPVDYINIHINRVTNKDISLEGDSHLQEVKNKELTNITTVCLVRYVIYNFIKLNSY